MNERFIYINNNKTDYTVSDTGDVYSLNYGRTNTKRKLTLLEDKMTGYLCVNIYYKKKLYRKYVHRLVAEAFIYNFENKPEVNHIDGNKKNNNVSNLEWCTDRENTVHAIKTGLRKIYTGENATDAKISNKTAHKICQMLEDNLYGTREISDKLDVPTSIVNNIKHKKCWLEVSKLYNIDNHNTRSKPIQKQRNDPEKITEAMAIRICELLQNTNLKVKDISKVTGVNKYKINAILYGTGWKKLSSNYDFSKRKKKKG